MSERPGEIPIAAFVGDAPMHSATVSPAGDRIAFLTTRDGTPMIGVIDLATSSKRAILAMPDLDLQPAWIGWANDDRLLFSADAPLSWSIGVRARSRLLFAIDADGQNLHHMGAKWFGRTGKRTKPSPEAIHRIPIQFEDRIVHWLPDDPQHVLLKLSPPRSRFGTGVYKLDVNSGDLDLVVPATEKIQQWYADPSGWVGMGVGSNRKGGIRLFARATDHAPFEEVAEFDILEGPGLSPLALKDRTTAYVASAHASDTAAIYEYDLQAKKFGRRVYGRLDVDVEQILYNSSRQSFVGARYTIDEPQTHYWDDIARAEQAAIDRVLAGRTNVIYDRSLDDDRVLVRSSTDTVPPSVYLFDRSDRHMQELYTENPGLMDVPLANTTPVGYTARDGLDIPAYLTVPTGADRTNLPVVVLPHGGPWARDRIRFDPEVQLLASRGYAVFQMNFRGSTGYGTRFTRAGYEEFGGKMQDDVTDGVQWLIDQGIADPDRIAIYGISYGGYAALMGAAKTPDLYRCAVSYAGLTDLNALIQDLTWYKVAGINARVIGRDSAKRRQNSPVALASHMKIPILIGHGEDDSKIHVSQARDMARALESKNKKVELAIFESEIHGTRNTATRVEWYTRLLSFLDVCLRPRPADGAPT